MIITRQDRPFAKYDVPPITKRYRFVNNHFVFLMKIKAIILSPRVEHLDASPLIYRDNVCFSIETDLFRSDPGNWYLPNPHSSPRNSYRNFYYSTREHRTRSISKFPLDENKLVGVSSINKNIHEHNLLNKP